MKFTRFLLPALLASTSLFAAGKYSGGRAPSFSLPDANLVQYDILDYRGQPLLLEFMSANCTHCRDFAPKLEEVKKKYAGRIAILSIATYPPDNQATVNNYLQVTNSTGPVLFDCGQVTRAYLKVTPDSAKRDLPHIFLIDASGTIRNDFEPRPGNEKLFTVEGLSAEIDKLTAKAK